ncbi:MAG: GTP diphosphokinase [Chloroflexi bacterium]|nr:MAG: GTP diphosphokinase [Chloroflexota bacterium]HDN81081.1 GTP diphosphokinase [Chloroflexota bacterium]
MNEIKDLLDSIREPEGRQLVSRAYELAKVAHEGQVRASGEPYIQHSLAVAHILSDLRLDPATIAAGLLHDVVEDTILDVDDIRAEFGEEVARLVDGVTKLEKMEKDRLQARELSRAYEQAESIRKMFLAMVDDVRVVLIKLADRLHNMRTLGSLPEHKRRRIAQETLEIFAPLANRLGIWKIKWELEDLAFRYLEPDKYKEIAMKLDQRRKDRERYIAKVIETLQKRLKEAGIEAEITGRPKHIYSIYQKMKRKNLDFNQIYDLHGVRIIVNDIKDCYAALGVVHSLWPPIPGEFDDYIATPKDNMYRSLHTAVVGPGGKPLEVQIRTYEMHRVAEYGIAAHWRYKEQAKRDVEFENKIAWLRQILEWRQEVTDAREFIDSLKSDFFQDRVYVFTPKGDVIDLPAGSTPIDFAYHIHTEIGHRCRGARVNGKIVPLDYQLKSGDQVEIITAKRGGPSRDWLNPDLGYVKTSRARQKIRLWFKKQARAENIAQGRELLDKELKRLRIDVDYEEVAQMFGYKSADDFLAAIGYGDIHPQQVATKLLQMESQEEELPKPRPTVRESPGVTVLGVGNLLTHLAKCCNPVPGDAIVGYVTKGRGISIHRADCPNILHLKDRERLIQVSWGQESRARYPVTITVKAFDREGLFRDIATVVANEGVNIASGEITTRKKDHVAIIKTTLEISTASQLTRILDKISRLPNVIEAYRHTG